MLRQIAVLALITLSAIVLLLPNRGLADEAAPADSDAGNGGAGNLFGQLDTNKDGQLVGDEIPEDRRRLFERLLRTGDKNNDGKLDAAEFAVALKGGKPEAGDTPPARPEGRPDRGPDAGEMFKRLDKNNDGKVTIDEVPEPRREGFKKLIERGDKDADGAVTQQELGDALRAMAGRGGRPDGKRPEPQQLFRRMDRNGDGKVTADEAPEERRERLEKLIVRADKDGDKAVTLEEFKTSLDNLAKVKPGKGKPGKGKPGKNKPDKAALKARLAGGAAPQPVLFNAIDSDHDGKLSSSEISAAADVIRKLDTNADGNVSFEEIAPAASK